MLKKMLQNFLKMYILQRGKQITSHLESLSQPDRTFCNFRASKSCTQGIICCCKTRMGGFSGSKIGQCSVGKAEAEYFPLESLKDKKKESSNNCQCNLAIRPMHTYMLNIPGKQIRKLNNLKMSNLILVIL